MIRGTVRIRGREGPIIFWEPQIDVAVAGVNLQFKTVAAVVDTGFTGALALSGEVIRELGLTHQDERLVRLATGTQAVYVYGAVVSWFGEPRAVPVHETHEKPLIGNMLLTNCRLAIDFQEDGAVTIRPL